MSKFLIGYLIVNTLLWLTAIVFLLKAKSGVKEVSKLLQDSFKPQGGVALPHPTDEDVYDKVGEYQEEEGRGV